MIASIAFRNFKALRNTQVSLAPFNLVIGANGSGKSSLIEALQRLRTLSKLPLGEETAHGLREGSPEVTFRFTRPFENWEARMSCVSDDRCDLLQLRALRDGKVSDIWPALRERIQGVRSFEFNHQVIGAPAPLESGAELSSDGANLAAVLALRRQHDAAAFNTWRANVLEALHEYDEVGLESATGGAAVPQLGLRLRGEKRMIPYYDLSQGTLYALAILSLGHDPRPPSVVCIEELDRGLHPRLLRHARDALYRLTHPRPDAGREPVQVIATTHSPYLLDLFRDRPEEVIVADKQGRAATFMRLSDRADLKELMEGVSLGDLWYTGILGGVPDGYEAGDP